MKTVGAPDRIRALTVNPTATESRVVGFGEAVSVGYSMTCLRRMIIPKVVSSGKADFRIR